MFCGSCGSKIFEGDAFCCNCGAKAGEGAVRQQPPQPIVSPVQPQPVSKVPQPASPQATTALRDKLMKRKWVAVALASLVLLGVAIGAVLIFTDLGRSGYDAEPGSTDGETILATHTITVRLNFPGAENAPPLTITEGTTIAELPTPERSGYTFTHWTSDSAGQQVLPPETPITEDSTLYAQWEVEEIDPYSLFSDLLAQYREIVENQYFMDDRWLGELQEQELSTDWLWWLNWQTHMNDGSIPAYFAFYDINNNGIPDLILGSGTEHRSTVLGIHTWVDGETYLLEINPHGSWLGERSNIFISQDGIIVNSGSSSALSGGATFFEISTDGRSVDIVDELWHDLHEVFDWGDDWDEDLWGAPDDRRGFFRGDEEITEEEYDEIFLQFFGVRSEQWDVAWENELVLEWHPIVVTSTQANADTPNDIRLNENFGLTRAQILDLYGAPLREGSFQTEYMYYGGIFFFLGRPTPNGPTVSTILIADHTYAIDGINWNRNRAELSQIFGEILAEGWDIGGELIAYDYSVHFRYGNFSIMFGMIDENAPAHVAWIFDD